MDIENRIYELADKIFGIDFATYTKNTGRVLLGVEINPNTQQLEHLFGNVPSNFLTIINSKGFFDTKAGYKVDIGKIFPLLTIKADIFLLNTNNLSDGPKELDSLIIHELCHMVLDSNSLDKATLGINEKDKYHGRKLYKKTDFFNENTTQHTQEFCTVLAAASQIASEKCEHFNDRWDGIDMAMRYDLLSNLRI